MYKQLYEERMSAKTVRDCAQLLAVTGIWIGREKESGVLTLAGRSCGGNAACGNGDSCGDSRQLESRSEVPGSREGRQGVGRGWTRVGPQRAGLLAQPHCLGKSCLLLSLIEARFISGFLGQKIIFLALDDGKGL